MTDQELIDINVDELEPEQARLIGIELLSSDIDKDKATLKRSAIVAAILSAGMVLAGMDTIPAYALMGVDTIFLYEVFDKIQAIIKKKKQLKSFEESSYKEGYKEFIAKCQEYVKGKYKYLKNPEKFINLR